MSDGVKTCLHVMTINQSGTSPLSLVWRLLEVDLDSAHPLNYNMSRSSEQDPLLPSSYSQEQDQYQADSPSTWRERVSEALESSPVHKLVITLVRYSFLSCIVFSLISSLVDRHRRWMCSRRSCLHPFIL